MSLNHVEQERTPVFWAAPELIDAGYKVFPSDSKAPTVEGGFYGATDDKSQVAAWIEDGRGDHDVTVATGVFGGFVAVDADTSEAYKRMKARYGLPTYTTKRGGHWLFGHPRNGKVVSNKIGPGLDRKGEGGYVVFPPSQGRQWTNGIPHLKDLQILPEEFWSKTKGPTPGERKIPEDIKDKAATIVSRYVRRISPNAAEGGRHEHLLHLSGVLLSRGVSLVDAEDILVAAWSKTGDAELAERAAREIPNTLATTQLALKEEKASGVPKMEKITPGLFDDLAPIMGWLREVRIGGRKLGDSSDSSDSDSRKSTAEAPEFAALRDLPDPEEFPVSVLPSSVRRLVIEAAAAIGCPPDYLAVGAMASMSSAIGDTRRIAIKKGWDEGAAIYAMIVGGPASKKSPALYEAMRPVVLRQVALKTEYRRRKEEYEIELAGWDKDDPEGKPKKPNMGRTYVDDTTVEKLADILNNNPRGVALIKDELSGWLGSMDQYKQGGKGGDRQKWLQIHTNRPISVDRKSVEEPVLVAHPYVPIVGGIQPEVLPDFGTDRGDGLMDRFVAAYPEPRRSWWTDDEISDEAREKYKDLIDALYSLEPSGEAGDEYAQFVGMSAEAKRVFVAEYNALHEELDNPGFPQRLRPVYGKLEGYLARFALILAMARRAEDRIAGRSTLESVCREDMEGAAALLSYFKNHARRVYTGLYGDNASDNLAADTRTFLIDKEGVWEGTASELHEALVSEYKPERPEDLAKAVRVIAKRSPMLCFEELKRTKTRRAFRLTLEIAVTAVTAVTPASEEEAAWEETY